MFNAPRPQQRYASSSTNGFGSASFTADNPLAGSTYDGLDPWSASATPEPGPRPSTTPSVFTSVIGDALVPPIYQKAYTAVDPSNTGETTVNALSRVLGTSSLPASTIDRIVNLVSSRPKVSKLEFFVALALVALAQSGKDLSIEQVASLASHNNLPSPSLDLDALPPSMSALPTTSPTSSPAPLRSPAPPYSSDDPWSTARYASGGIGAVPGLGTNGAHGSNISGTGLPKDWWKRQEKVNVTIAGQQGFILARYTVYEVASGRGSPVSRRYSEFVFLWDCLVRRYPFRILPQLPPKRIGADESFLEQRRRGLSRFLNFVVNHPVIKEDGLLAVFLTEPSLENWRKHTAISLDEESVSKRVDRVEEMSIPSDLEEKLDVVRRKIGILIEQWQKICLLTERILKRREAAAADLSRLNMTLNALNEVNEVCWRGDVCELCEGVRQGLTHVSGHVQIEADTLEQRVRVAMATTLEALKSQRDLYIAMRDLFIRHDRLGGDQVERIKKRVEANQMRLEAVKVGRKEGWEAEAERVANTIERDQAAIAAALNRRVFVRFCMWHELRVVLHNRENALVTQAVRDMARAESTFAEEVARQWTSLSEAVEGMPYE
ncbi:hypothetical protein BD410DRAFT_768122 [Rickenella mellea]|uniref:Sorting nexin MVP1 n=1 Tax=Rickenella mellea TaxID=50990 RepID=A0A4Y7Q9S2_9AGAM|nr:hypothetical protein BD410DRAFT_768122 [Rickenella mellea]